MYIITLVAGSVEMMRLLHHNIFNGCDIFSKARKCNRVVSLSLFSVAKKKHVCGNELHWLPLALDCPFKKISLLRSRLSGCHATLLRKVLFRGALRDIPKGDINCEKDIGNCQLVFLQDC